MPIELGSAIHRLEENLRMFLTCPDTRKPLSSPSTPTNPPTLSIHSHDSLLNFADYFRLPAHTRLHARSPIHFLTVSAIPRHSATSVGCGAATSSGERSKEGRVISRTFQRKIDLTIFKSTKVPQNHAKFWSFFVDFMHQTVPF